MSRFDFQYMRENFKVGFADTLGQPWWSCYGDVSDVTYPGAIPMDDARSFLSWAPEKVALMREDATTGEAVPLRYGWGDTPVGIVRPDTGALVGIMDENYPATSYAERLLDGLTSILDDPDLNIGSVLMLDGGRKASVQITMGNLTETSDDAFRLWIAAYTSLDGSTKTTFKKGATRIQCDNTFDAFVGEGGAKHAYKNTANSGLDISTAREALDIFSDINTELSDTVESMVNAAFSGKQWESLLDTVHPIKGESKQGDTRAENKRLAISDLYYHDDRVRRFNGTQWGAFQAFSTYHQHESTVRKGDNELQRNTRWMLDGAVNDHDNKVLAAIASVK